MFRRIVNQDYALYRLKNVSKDFLKVPEPPSQPEPPKIAGKDEKIEKPTVAGNKLQPILVGEFKGHNIVSYGSIYYVVPQSLGPLDLSKREDRLHKEIFASPSIKEAKKRILFLKKWKKQHQNKTVP